jgi:ATP-dependent helicase HrpB
MIPLPIDAVLPEIVEHCRVARRVVLVAPPGAGKTTRVPVALVRAGLMSAAHPALIILQPRRVAARAAAERIATENGWTLGHEVGHHIRFERKIRHDTRIRVVTEGILNRQLVSDPFLEGVGAVILDEFHERSLDTDLAIALLREIRATVRDDLIVVVMSATMDAEPVAQFLDDAPIVRAEGRSYPVTIRYRPPTWPREPIPDRVASAVIAVESPGDVLAFLPGAEEIRRAGGLLSGWAAETGSLVLPLHGGLTGVEQDRALRPSDRRKVVLATNIAETSLTIDGVTTVVDAGYARFASHDAARGLDRLELGRISRASADQRAGRAGRTGPGSCVRLWSEAEQRGFAELDAPEVARVDLAATVLALHAWGHADPAQFGWFEPPPPENLAAAERLLTMLGALDGEGGSITELGKTLLGLPVHPRLGRLLVEAARIGASWEGATLAALLSEKDILSRGPGRDARPGVRATSDVLIRLDRLDDAERSRFAPELRDRGVDPAAARQVARVRDDLLRVARRIPGPERAEPSETDLLRLILVAYPDRVARRRAVDPASGVMVGGRGVRLEPESVVRDGELFVALDPRDDRHGSSVEARVRVASRVELDWLAELFPGSVRKERSVRFDEERRRVVGVATLAYRDLILREDPHAAVTGEEAERVLAETLAPRAREIFEADEAAASWLARLELARRAMPELEWPELVEADWRELILAACAGKRGEAEVMSAPLVSLLRGRLTYAAAKRLDDEVPEALVVPSGSRIRLAYSSDGPPILAARLQELFGWRETPRLALGRVPVVLHLLGPNFRPVQITEDLRNFWATTYFQVRKDLRARYPKHSWPEDPLSARPEARGGRPRPG